MKMKKGLILALSIAASMLFTCISNAEDKEFIDVTVTSEAELFDAPIIFKSNNISEINISNLNKMRDDFIRSNYNIYLEKLETDASSFEEYYNEMLNSPYGISKFFEEKYGNLNDEDLLKKEITFINFMNQNDICFINVQGFIPNYYNTYEGLIFRKKHNKQNLIKQTKQMSENELKELFQFYYENIIEYLNNADSDVDLIFQIVYPQGIDNLDDEFEKQIREKYEKKALNNKFEKTNQDRNDNNKKIESFFNLVEIDNNRNESVDTTSYQKRGTSIRRYTLNYARKYGYTNDYAGSFNPPYHYLNYSNNGGDCANFVSQCLDQGHIDYKYGPTYDSNKSWYFHNGQNWSLSWLNAQYFRLHWQQRVPAYYKYVKNSLSFLDPAIPVSMLDKLDNYRAFHTLLPTDRHSNGYNFSYAAHSDIGKRTNLLQKLKLNPDIKYYRIGWS